jgi:hypothetical protein
MDSRGGTSINDLMRQPNNSQMSDDESMVQSILEEINQDKEQINQNARAQQMEKQKMEQQQMQQQMQKQQMNQQKMMEQENMLKQRQQLQMMEQKRMMEMQRQEMEKQRMLSSGKPDIVKDNNDSSDFCSLSLLDEFKSSIIFFSIFVLINITQFNNVICGLLSIENNNIFVLLKAFIATIIFFSVNKIIQKFI